MLDTHLRIIGALVIRTSGRCKGTVKVVLCRISGSSGRKGTFDVTLMLQKLKNKRRWMKETEVETGVTQA